MKTPNNFEYPFYRQDCTIKQVPVTNEYMKMAKLLSEKKSKTPHKPNACVIVSEEGLLISTGANGSDAHKNGCARKKVELEQGHDFPHGKGYNLCLGCTPSHHGETTAVRNALTSYSVQELKDMNCVAYLYGHFYVCSDCWDALVTIGIDTVYVVENADIIFNKESHENSSKS